MDEESEVVTSPAETPPKDPPPVTSPDEWRRRRQARFRLRLPSGFVVEAVKPDLLALGLDGEIDLQAIPKIIEMSGSEQNKASIELMEKLLPHVVVVPRIGRDGSEDALDPDLMSRLDKLAVFGWLTELNKALVEEYVL